MLHYTKLILFLVGISLATRSHSLEVVPAGKLPTPRSLIAGVYDNERYIYLLGGFDNAAMDDVLRYDLETEIVEQVGSFPQSLFGGTAHFDVNGNIYYLGGAEIDHFLKPFSNIWKLNAENPYPLTVAHLPKALAFHCSVYAPNIGIFLMGGLDDGVNYFDKIYLFDSETNKTQVFKPPTSISRHKPSCAGFEESAYIFGGYHNGYLNTILKSNPTKGVELLNTTLPVPNLGASAVAVGDEIYVIGGDTGNNSEANYITKFNPATEQIELLRPKGLKQNLSLTSTIYIPNLKRIYVFGGYLQDSGNQDDIFYIQLDN